jgi:rubrerythrin
MFSKDPSELIRKEKFDDEEISRSIRLALAAELDAINFYLQQSKLMPDGAFKKVHEDIAKEEITHFGEFLRLMHEYTPDDFEKINSGWNEASDLLGKNVNLLGVKSSEREEEKKREVQKQSFMDHIKTINWDESGLLLPDKNETIVPFKKLSLEFKIEKGMKDVYQDLMLKNYHKEFEANLESFLFEESSISLRKSSTKISVEKMSPESIVSASLKAIKMLSDANYDDDIEAMVSFELYENLLKTFFGNESLYETLRKVVNNVKLNTNLKGKAMIIFKSDMFFAAVKKAPKLHKISEDVDSINYGIYGWILPLLLDKKASILVEFK